jgi:hypothetical protein
VNDFARKKARSDPGLFYGGFMKKLMLAGLAAFPFIACLDPAPDTDKVSTNWNAEAVDTSYIRKAGNLVLLSNGLPALIYGGNGYRYSEDGNLYLYRCGNADCTAGNSILQIDSSRAGAAWNLALALPADGLPVMTYGQSEQIDFTQYLLKCGTPDCTSGNLKTRLGGSGNSTAPRSAPFMTLGADGFPTIVYLTDFALRVTKCLNATCSQNSIHSLDAGSDPSLIPHSILVPGDGLPLIVYMGSSQYSLRALKCGTPDCAAGNSFVTLVPKAVYGAAAAIGMDGLPVVAYFKDGLNVLKCGNAACSDQNTRTRVDSRGDGNHISLIIPADGHPIIGYAPSAGDVSLFRIMKCGNSNCTSGNRSVLVDETGNPGRYSSLLLSGEGTLLASYLDEAFTFDLKIARCKEDCFR